MNRLNAENIVRTANNFCASAAMKNCIRKELGGNIKENLHLHLISSSLAHSKASTPAQANLRTKEATIVQGKIQVTLSITLQWTIQRATPTKEHPRILLGKQGIVTTLETVSTQE